MIDFDHEKWSFGAELRYHHDGNNLNQGKGKPIAPDSPIL